MVFRPARLSPRTIFSSAPSVATDNGATAAASPPQATIRPCACRVSARAATAVPATAALTTNPWRDSASQTFAIMACFATEQVRAAGDVEEQAVDAVQRHQRREAVAPVGDGVERLCVGHRIGVDHLERRQHRARGRKRHLDVKASNRRRIVQRRELKRVVDLRGDHQRRIVRRCGDALLLQAAVAVGRQARQPHAEDAPSVRGKGTHHSSIP